jgi:hypothetical protein
MFFCAGNRDFFCIGNRAGMELSLGVWVEMRLGVRDWELGDLERVILGLFFFC